MQSALLCVRPQTLLWTFKVFFFHFWNSHCDECFIPALLELEQSLHGVCWSELGGERLCWLSTISQSVFMCVRWSISLLTLVSQAPRSARFLSVGQHLACCHGFIAPPVTVAVRFLFTARLKAASLFFPLYTHTHCMHMCVCVFGSSLSCKCRSDGSSYFYLTIMLKWFSVYMFPSCVIMNVMWM